MHAHAEENVAMADELVLSQEDKNSSFNTPSIAQLAVVWIFFHGDLGLKLHPLKV